MFSVEMLPAGRGDSLWIEYGEPPRRILIDGGIAGTAVILRQRLLALPEEERRFELLAVTHIDVDHIGGIVRLLADPPAGLSIGDVWFNGRGHLEEDPFLGVRDGERLMEVLNLAGRSWNQAFGGGAVVLPETGSLPVVDLPGGMRLTLLGPGRQRLQDLAEHWDDELEDLGIVAKSASLSAEDEGGFLAAASPNVELLARSPFQPDGSVPNGSSIALLTEHAGKRVLFAGDAYAGEVLAAVRTLAAAEGGSRLEVDALKLSHHGGRKNTSVELLAALACKRFLFSSDGTIYDHPQPESVARVIVHGRARGRPELWFNYRSEENRVWDDVELFEAPGKSYEPLYPAAGAAGIRIEL
jgi:hypothetical protein